MKTLFQTHKDVIGGNSPAIKKLTADDALQLLPSGYGSPQYNELKPPVFGVDLVRFDKQPTLVSNLDHAEYADARGFIRSIVIALLTAVAVCVAFYIHSL